MTLMVGGPRNGEDCKTPHEQRQMAVPVHQLTTTYRLERVVLFGRIIPVWLHESVRTEGDACHNLLKLLLNEQGWEIWKNGVPR